MNGNATRQGHVVEAPVRCVTVLEDRAQIQRRARVRLTPGRHVLVVDRVTPLVVDRTLRGGVSGEARLVDLEVSRSSTVAATRPWLQQQLEEQLERLRQERVATRHALEQARAERQRLQQVWDFLIQHVAEQAGRGVDRRADWRRDMEQLEQRLSTSTETLEELQVVEEELEQRLDRVEQRHWAAMQPTAHYWASLSAVVEVTSPGELELTWEYLVPCALWRPAHQAELVESDRVRWTLLGTVWQNTGEAWDEVELRLSTERPTLGAELPLLEEDQLHIRPKTDEEKRIVEVSSRDEAIEQISPGLDAEARVGVVPGVDDGGEARVFTAGQRVTIPPDGRAHLVTLDTFECETRLDLVCYPELAEAAMLRSQQRNAGQRPLLAGPVHLVRRGGFAGRTQVPFVAPGEPFALGWGSLDDLQVARRSGQREAEEKALSRRVRHRIWSRVYLSNTGDEARTLQVTERIPVSEVEQVEVRLLTKETTGGYREAKDGHLTWEVELPPGGNRELELAYEVDAHRKVVWR
jgi:uncharacterized protein (TIGR02231 family)